MCVIHSLRVPRVLGCRASFVQSRTGDSAFLTFFSFTILGMYGAWLYKLWHNIDKRRFGNGIGIACGPPGRACGTVRRMPYTLQTLPVTMPGHVMMGSSGCIHPTLYTQHLCWRISTTSSVCWHDGAHAPCLHRPVYTFRSVLSAAATTPAVFEASSQHLPPTQCCTRAKQYLTLAILGGVWGLKHEIGV